MNYLAIELSGRTMMLMGALSSVAIILLTIWLAKRANKKAK